MSVTRCGRPLSARYSSNLTATTTLWTVDDFGFSLFGLSFVELMISCPASQAPRLAVVDFTGFCREISYCETAYCLTLLR